MNDHPLNDNPAPHRDQPVAGALEAAVATALPQSPEQFGAQLIKGKWGQEIDPYTTLLVTLDYGASADQDGILYGQVNNSRTLVQALLANYQTLGDGRFDENLFGFVTPPAMGPAFHVLDAVNNPAAKDKDYYTDYEGIYRCTSPQVYGPSTQIALSPADFKKWVWELDLRSRYQTYLDQVWPSDERVVRAEPCALRTSVKAAFVMSACLQHQEGSLSQEGFALAMQAAGLPAEQTWCELTLTQLQAATRPGPSIEASRLTIYRYTATDIWCYRHRPDTRVLLYIPGNSSPLHEFADVHNMREWIVVQGRAVDTRQALAAHFAEDDLEDGTFHAGVSTALEGMAIYPREHRLKKNAGFFNNDGYWDPQDYIGFERSSASTELFAQLVLAMKQGAMASVKTIRSDAQVNRDHLSTVVESVAHWINQFGPLALFVPGGEGLLVLAGIIDAGYGLEQAVDGKTPEERSAGVTRMVFGLLNALPLAAAGVALKGERATAGTLEKTLREPAKPVTEPADHLLPGIATAAPQLPSTAVSRLELMRGVCAPLATFSDEVLSQIAKVSTVDDDLLRLMQAGRPPTPLLADTISRFKLDQELEVVVDPQARAELFSRRYQALQQSEHEWVRLLQREYPGLPKNVVEQILDRSGVDIAQAVEPAEALPVIKRLDSKAREYQGHVRLNRAYESLYLRSTRNPDADVLALHSLKRLSGWPGRLRIEVLEGSISGRVLDRCGPPGVPDCRRLIKVGDRYRSAALADSVAGVDLPAAVFDVLSIEERSTLSLSSAADLRQRLGEWALPRSELMLGLNRMDAKLPFDSWGLRGGGFPDTPQGLALTHATMRLRVKDVYPEFTDAQTDEFLLRAGSGADVLLDHLDLQLQQLHFNLQEWIDMTLHDIDDMDLEFLQPGDAEAQDMTAAQVEAHNAQLLEHTLEYERETRSELADDLIAIWQKRSLQETRVMSGEEFVGYRLDLDFEDYHRLPDMSVRFDEVVELSMKGMHLIARESLDAFLEGFPNLRILNLERLDLRRLNMDDVLESALPTPILEMKHLTALNLKSTFLQLKESTASQFRNLARLQTLDLSDNPLATAPVVLGMNDLHVLNLKNTGITHCPIGIPEEPRMTALDLRDNHISRVPYNVLDQAVSRDRVKLWGNPLTDEETLLRLVEHRERTGINLWLDQPGIDYGSASSWLEAVDEPLRTTRRQLWERLWTKPSGNAVLRVMDGLSLTADFQVGYRELQARVWRLLHEVDASEELWGWLSHCVETTLADAQNPFRLFGVLEDRARLHHDWIAMGRPIPFPAH
ncbi:dermonecrotic toxin domain-containing protein [Pseudomonas sp. B21-048]|uniref:dermonecrotic toxin domain-containing protein n=1 Tax=Pseudomonas sp. B21-048 TaxID=2895490 RepID=UPI0021607F6F|nr:DUF6543 domain-containing protein [Pseudomonas sp. B21-048]UVK96787.1 hypothetical protein LOY56_15440 [Pseudomonas sp. B21-048]